MDTPAVAAWPACDRPDWRLEAACRDADPELFFPEAGTGGARAKVKTARLICRGCPVSATCLNWALDTGQEAGIWGGLTEGERHRLRRRLRPAADGLAPRQGC
jgi:WhiB family redox-sensing transcriptional regulator